MHTCRIIEKCIEEECANLTTRIHPETLFNVANKVFEQEDTKVVLRGCNSNEHQHSLTKHILNFILITRMMFICKEANKTYKDEKRKTGLRKAAKY